MVRNGSLSTSVRNMEVNSRGKHGMGLDVLLLESRTGTRCMKELEWEKHENAISLKTYDFNHMHALSG